MRTERGPRAIRLPFPLYTTGRAAVLPLRGPGGDSRGGGEYRARHPRPSQPRPLADKCGISERAAASLLAALDSLGLATGHADLRTGDVVLGRRPAARLRAGLTGSPGIWFLHSVLAAMSAVSPGRGTAGHSVLHNCPQGRDARHVA
jgi:hypothetical protein